MKKFPKIMKNTLSGMAVAGLLTFWSTALGGPQEAHAQSVDRGEIEQIVREYLLSNPEIILEVQEALETKQRELQAAQQANTLAERKEQIYNSPNQMIIGDPNAPVTVVEFFDYNCGFCRRALADMDRIVSENPDVKFVMKEFPVLGEASLEAHRISLAVIRLYPELYDRFHRDLLSVNGRKDANAAIEIAVGLGADASALASETEKPEITTAIREVYELADGLSITGTPSYVLGDEVVFGAVGYDRIMPKVANLQKCGSTRC